jgi:hypothetical protein
MMTAVRALSSCLDSKADCFETSRLNHFPNSSASFV